MNCVEKVNCRLCESTKLVNFLDLGCTPPGNHFVSQNDLGTIQDKYPLTVKCCESCFHVQLGHVVDPVILYKNDYSYVSSVSPVFLRHLDEYAEMAVNRFNLNDKSLVLDIGSNDGAALKAFQNRGCRVLGVDPAQNIVDIANRSGVETKCLFFSEDSAKQLSVDYGQFDYITSHNVCAHIDELKSVMLGVKNLLKSSGAFVFEVGYFLDVYEKGYFDTIYHEHLDFHTLHPLVRFFKSIEMEVFHVERVQPQGGSIRVFVQHINGPNALNNSVESLCLFERKNDFQTLEKYFQYSEKIDKVKNKLLDIILDLKYKSKKIAGFGAPTKATTLMSYFDIYKHIDYIVDDNPLKQNLYSPGFHVPVYKADIIYESKPDYLIILAWNFADDIIRKHSRFKEQGGKFIIPNPVPKII